MKTTFLKIIFITTLVLVTTGCSSDDNERQPQPFTYSQNQLNTGVISSGGTTAPEGYNWAEIKAPYNAWGFTGNHQTGYSLSDDFAIPQGEKWNIENIYLYAYQTNFEGGNFPLSEMYLEIYSSKPDELEAEKVYGDYTTNRFVSSEDAKLYRIISTTSDDFNRKLYKIKVNTEGLKLTEGTYWIKFTGKLSNGLAFFFVGNPYEEPNDFNAIQLNVDGDWTELKSNEKEVSLAFEIEGTK